MKLKKLIPESYLTEADVLSAEEKSAKANAQGKDKPYNETITEISKSDQENEEWFNGEKKHTMNSAKDKLKETLKILGSVRDKMKYAGSTARLDSCINHIADTFDFFQDELTDIKNSWTKLTNRSK